MSSMLKHCKTISNVFKFDITMQRLYILMTNVTHFYEELKVIGKTEFTYKELGEKLLE